MSMSRAESETRESRYLLLPLMELMLAHSQCTKGNSTNRYETPISPCIKRLTLKG